MHKSNLNVNHAHHANHAQNLNVEPLSDFGLDPPLYRCQKSPKNLFSPPERGLACPDRDYSPLALPRCHPCSKDMINDTFQRTNASRLQHQHCFILRFTNSSSSNLNRWFSANIHCCMRTLNFGAINFLPGKVQWFEKKKLLCFLPEKTVWMKWISVQLGGGGAAGILIIPSSMPMGI